MKINRKWFIIGLVGLAVVTALSVGVVLAADNGDTATTTSTTNPPQTTTTTSTDTLIDKIIAIYQQKTGVTIDKAALQASIDEARKEIQTEALQARLQALVSAGKITQAEADQILSWWQSRPDVLSNIGLGGHGMGRLAIGGFCFRLRLR
jgi:ABC-type glycerol-3-phosphate transport system substrate-binding protein